MANRKYQKMDCGVYAITHIESGKRYIGSSRVIAERGVAHRNLLNRNQHYNLHLQRAWNKDGQTAFSFSKVLVCSKEDRLFYEQLIIDALKATNNRYGFNLALRAGGGVDMHSEETKKIMSEKVRIAYAEGRIPGHRKPHTEIAKARIRAAASLRKGKPGPNKGRKFSAEFCDKQKQIKLALYKNPEFLAKHNTRKLTHCKRGHPFNGDNLYVAPDGERGCRACMRHNAKSWISNNREKYLALRKASYQRRKNKA